MGRVALVLLAALAFTGCRSTPTTDRVASFPGAARHRHLVYAELEGAGAMERAAADQELGEDDVFRARVGRFDGRPFLKLDEPSESLFLTDEARHLDARRRGLLLNEIDRLLGGTLLDVQRKDLEKARAVVLHFSP